MAYMSAIYRPLIEYLKDIEDLFSMELHRISQVIEVTDSVKAETLRRKSTSKIQTLNATIRKYRIEIKQDARLRESKLKFKQLQMDELLEAMAGATKELKTIIKGLEQSHDAMNLVLEKINATIRGNNLEGIIEMHSMPVDRVIKRMENLVKQYPDMVAFINKRWKPIPEPEVPEYKPKRTPRKPQAKRQKPPIKYDESNPRLKLDGTPAKKPGRKRLDQKAE